MRVQMERRKMNKEDGKRFGNTFRDIVREYMEREFAGKQRDAYKTYLSRLNA
jgi:hypothetical protein